MQPLPRQIVVPVNEWSLRENALDALLCRRGGFGDRRGRRH
ncbi:MAG TPA: hypothetical protein VEH54_08220 [Steroidobacteraceae bacterium]|nr:hypothetical protein [Steroidobacteraceae bacterium]